MIMKCMRPTKYSQAIAIIPNTDRLKLMNPTNKRNINLPLSVYMNPKFVAINLDIICKIRTYLKIRHINMCKYIHTFTSIYTYIYIYTYNFIKQLKKSHI
jgi:hypothetical protein